MEISNIPKVFWYSLSISILALTFGLLFIAYPDHEHPAFETEHLARHAERTSPLPGAGFGGKPLYAKSLVVIGLSNGGIGLV